LTTQDVLGDLRVARQRLMDALREYDDAIEAIHHRQVADLVAECRRLEALLLEESRVSAARFHALNEVRAIVNLPKVEGDPIPGLADAVRAAVQPSAGYADEPRRAPPKLPSADHLAEVVDRLDRVVVLPEYVVSP
jgi:hypothetical protein